MMLYTEKSYIKLSERFNRQSFMGKIITIKNNPTLFTIDQAGNGYINGRYLYHKPLPMVTTAPNFTRLYLQERTIQ